MVATTPLLRSVLYTPGSNPRLLAKAPRTGADALILDLEDAVAPEAKALAREQVLEVLRNTDGEILRTVRINGLQTSWWREDVTTVLPGRPDAITVAKVEHPEALVSLHDYLAHLERGVSRLATTPLWAMIETPKGVIHAYAIASHPRVTALVMGTSDLAKALRLPRAKERYALHHALQQTILAARAARVLVLDGVFTDLTDAEGFAEQCREGARLGFDGKTLIHPSQVEPANLAFLPGEDEVAKARRIIAHWQQASALGEELCVVDGHLIERLHAQEAARLLQVWEQAVTPLKEISRP